MTKEENDKAVAELSKLAPGKEYLLADYPNAALSRVRLYLAMDYNLDVTIMNTKGTFKLSKIS